MSTNSHDQSSGAQMSIQLKNTWLPNSLLNQKEHTYQLQNPILKHMLIYTHLNMD